MPANAGVTTNRKTPLWSERIQAALRTIDEEVEHRRHVATTDPVAHGMAWSAQKVRETLALLESDADTMVTPAEWGAAQTPPVPAQTVRRWIREGLLPEMKGTRGYVLPLTVMRANRSN